jgi:hypothetical protein
MDNLLQRLREMPLQLAGETRVIVRTIARDSERRPAPYRPAAKGKSPAGVFRSVGELTWTGLWSLIGRNDT